MTSRLNLFILVAIVLGLSTGCTSERTKKPLDAPLTPAEMREDLQQYRDVVLNSWAYLESKRVNQSVDVSRSYEELVTRITPDTTQEQFTLLLKQFAASLEDGHSEVFGDGLADPFPNSWPIGFVLVHDGVVAANLNWLAENPGVELGDVLLSVDGRPIDEFMESRIRLVSASTGPARRKIAVDRLHWTNASSVTLTFLKPDGSNLEAIFPCLSSRIEFRSRKQSTFCEYSRLPNAVVQISIPTFAYNAKIFSDATSPHERESALAVAKRQVDDAFEAASKATGVVLDLRNNDGGFDLLSIYVAQHLVPGDFVYYDIERRDSQLLRARAGYKDMDDGLFGIRLPQRPRAWQGHKHFEREPYNGRLVVVINERCFSTTDNLCAFLQDARPRTKFLGQPTNGGTGEPAIVDTLANSRAQIQFCVSKVYSPNGRLIEGVGTKPDIRVDSMREDVAKGRDVFLEAALETLADW